ncbi:type II secretion system F family protein [Microvirga aerilata]|uniref:Type II secretion system F family protein n=1 Tax=Microvirga aerilata TaxID=670292 RepID=A0A936ZEY2_9HYPH|nr:type II secretion system F family protein [Microvirga aerilata]MBL0406540.1 type II secretion system F family protein [Microvirga aerilata]
MLTSESMPILIAVLAALGTIGVVISLFYSRVVRQSESSRRFAAIAGPVATTDRRTGHEETGRKKAIDATLKELEEKQKIKRGDKPSLAGRLRQAGLDWSTRTYYGASIGIGFGCFFLAFTSLGINTLTAAGFGIAGGILFPHLYVSMTRSRRLNGFSAEFPNAVDVIVRGVKSGLPLADCLRIISTEAQEPVRSEFRIIIEDQTLGIPVDQAVQRLFERIPLPETNFLGIVISLQSQTGGSLSEALGNLSKVLRERKKMKAKIKAVSSEAKASAAIIGSLPVLVTGLIYMTSPAYISLLFTTLIGNMVIAASALWMLIGVLVMRKMINFDI